MTNKPKRTRKKTSTKVRFNYRVEPEHVETLKEIAIYLNNLNPPKQ